jgi:predicted transcriptional regulator
LDGLLHQRQPHEKQVASTLDVANGFPYKNTTMPKKQNPPLSKTDLAILSVFWSKGQATGREIFDALVEKGDVPKSVAYTTVKTYLDRLIRKGYAKAKVLADPPGVYAYAATVAREEIMERHEVLEHVVESLHLTPAGVVRWFAGREKLSKADLVELKQIIEETKPSS